MVSAVFPAFMPGPSGSGLGKTELCWCVRVPGLDGRPPRWCGAGLAKRKAGRRRKGAVRMKRSFVILCVAGMMAVLSAASGATGSSGSSPVQRPECDENSPLCAEVYHSVGYGGGYTGHNEPALLFYSNAAGSGSSMTYQMTIPTEPPTPPTQDGTGGTDNFQLRPAFWLGMALW